MKKELPMAFDKKGLTYKMHMSIDTLQDFLIEYYKKYKKCDVLEICPISSIRGCGLDENNRLIIKGGAAFSVLYYNGVNKRTGKQSFTEEWFEDSNIEPKLQRVFDDYGYEIKGLEFHNTLFLKDDDSFSKPISEKDAPDYGIDNLISKCDGVTVVFAKKKISVKILSLFRGKKNNSSEN